MNQIKFSFIVPVYNVEKYLSRCLDSLLNQEYKNFEIICINDGSPDNSLIILEDYKFKSPNYFKIISQENQGLGAARNTGVKHSSGDYIWFIDSDDWIEKNALHDLSELIQNNNFPDMVIFDYYQSKDINSSKEITSIYHPIETLTINNYIDLLLSYNATFSAWCRIYKTEMYKKSKFEFLKGYYEDVPQIDLISQHVKTINYLHKNLYHYYINDTSITKSFNIRILDLFKQVKSATINIKKHKSIPYFIARSIYTTYKKLKFSDNNTKLEFYRQLKKEKLLDFNIFSILQTPNVKILSKLKIVVYIAVIKYFFLKYSWI